jgi:putative acetyltransferase
MSLAIEPVRAPTEDAIALIEELETELSVHYPAEQRHGLAAERVFQPNILFFIARQDGVAVGCGGIAFEPDFAELKRMYVRPAWRGRGIAQAILARLEQAARAQRVARLVLETGDVLHAAMRLYKSAGFTSCQAFGAYAAMPTRAIERSVFLEKWIG